jgi:two-component system, NtrC family, response regulator AtoC
MVREQGMGSSFDDTTARDVFAAPAAASADRFLVVVQLPGAAPRMFELTASRALTIGRQKECTISVEDARLSRQHARLAVDTAGRVDLLDLGSRNGLMVNDRQRPPGSTTLLVPGDLVRVGPIQLSLAAMPAPEAPALPEPDAVVVHSPVLREVFELARRVARLSTTVLISGETGSGKEVVAESIHRASPRSQGPLIRVNCASLPEGLLEAELFGHERGAFTGAEKRRVGFIEAAAGGTLFLDEVGELPPLTQSKLLVVLETKQLTRLGSSAPVSVDVRFLCATHRNLKADVASGRFREDLFYRLSAFVLEVPPLRARLEEVVPLARGFLAAMARETGEVAPTLTPEAIEVLCRHAWPGNVRELRNAMEHAFVHGGAEVTVATLPPLLSDPSAPLPENLRGELASREKASLEAALAKHQGNQTRAALALGLSRRALIHKMVKYGLKRPSDT